jgi:hypothetical protein
MLTTVKIWALDHDVIPNESDVVYCKTHGIQLDAQKGEHQRIETSNGQVFHYRSSPGVIKLTTFDDKSEAMLQLRYGNSVRLMSQMYTETLSYENKPQ